MEKLPYPINKAYVKPHKKPGREVKDKDLERLVEEACKMYDLCKEPSGLYPSALAISHVQVCAKDPLNFFVTNDGRVIINPRIERHSSYIVDSLEGCMSEPEKMPIIVLRWQKLEFSFQELTNDDTLSGFKLAKVSGREAWMIQHELGHCLEGKCIYDDVIIINPKK